VTMLEPAMWAGNQGCRVQLARGTAAQRGARLAALRSRGRIDFTRLDLKNIDLRGRTLRGLDFTGSDLSKAMLEGADLSRAVLADATLSGADFRRAKLEHVDVTTTQGWRDARCDDLSTMPEGWRCVDGGPVSAFERQTQ